MKLKLWKIVPLTCTSWIQSYFEIHKLVWRLKWGLAKDLICFKGLELARGGTARPFSCLVYCLNLLFPCCTLPLQPEPAIIGSRSLHCTERWQLKWSVQDGANVNCQLSQDQTTEFRLQLVFNSLISCVHKWMCILTADLNTNSFNIKKKLTVLKSGWKML